MADSVAGVILAGGQSRRFGSDKALFQIEGVPLIQAAYETLIQVASPLFVSVASTQTRYNIPATHLPDATGHAGPLAGIYAALNASPHDWLLVLAVDIPFITPTHLQKLLDARTPTTDAVIAASKDRIHPLCACYHKRSLPSAKKLLDQSTYRVTTFLNTLNTQAVKLTPSHILTNLNTPPDSKTRNPKPETRNR